MDAFVAKIQLKIELPSPYIAQLVMELPPCSPPSFRPPLSFHEMSPLVHISFVVAILTTYQW